MQQVAAQEGAHRFLVQYVHRGGHRQRGGKHDRRVDGQAELQRAQALDGPHHVDVEDVDGVGQLTQEIDGGLGRLAQLAESLLAGQRQHHQRSTGQADDDHAHPFVQRHLLRDQACVGQQRPGVERQTGRGRQHRQSGVLDEAGAGEQLGQQHAVDELDDVGIAPEGQCGFRGGVGMHRRQGHQQQRADEQAVLVRDLQGDEEHQIEEDLVVQRPAQSQQRHVVLDALVPHGDEEERAQQLVGVQAGVVEHAGRFQRDGGQGQRAQPVQRHDADQPSGEELRRPVPGHVVDDEARDDEEDVDATAAEGGESHFVADVADDHQRRGDEAQRLQRVEGLVGTGGLGRLRGLTGGVRAQDTCHGMGLRMERPS